MGTTLELVLGSGGLPPALGKGLVDIKAGGRRKILVPAAEVELFPFSKGFHLDGETETPPGIAYEFGSLTALRWRVNSFGKKKAFSIAFASRCRSLEVDMLSVQGPSVN